jgi:hypothetical protein
LPGAIATLDHSKSSYKWGRGINKEGVKELSSCQELKGILEISHQAGKKKERNHQT